MIIINRDEINNQFNVLMKIEEIIAKTKKKKAYREQNKVIQFTIKKVNAKKHERL